MNKRKQIRLKEAGITLVTLVITVIILIILAAIVIRTIVGQDGMIETTLTAKEEYTIAQYREALIQIAQGVIMGNTAEGKETTLEDIAEAIRQEEWVRTADPNEEGKNILVVTKEGYIFEVYYDGTFGSLKVEYVGKEPNIKDEDKVYPNITARYDNNTETIIANASVSKGNITKIELIYKDQVINTAENPNRRSKF